VKASGFRKNASVAATQAMKEAAPPERRASPAANRRQQAPVPTGACFATSSGHGMPAGIRIPINVLNAPR
jgi:hypothetical protein